ncbi:cytochrome P450 [Aspergillus filifer]
MALMLLAATAFIIYLTTLAIYRLYLSPISHFPGPKLAALTWWYQFYYDVVLQGRYMFKMQSLHAQYGPVIRINPCELHVADPEFMDTLYTGHSRKRDKWAFYTGVLGTPGAAMNTNGHELHRVRRSALNPFFSKMSIRNLQPLVDGKVDILLERLGRVASEGGIVNVNHAASAFTNDVVTEFCFGRCHDRLLSPDFDPSFHDKAKAGLRVIPFLASFPWIVRALDSLPPTLGSLLSNDYAEYIAEKNEILSEATKAMASRDSTSSTSPYRTIFHEILDSKLPPAEKVLERLADEAAVTLAAGTLTTAWVLTVGIYFIVATPSILRKLKAELEGAIPDSDIHTRTPMGTLEALPYLRACVQEAIRLGYGAPGRVNQIAPEEAMPVKRLHGETLLIPPGTPTSMTVYLVHHDEDLFPHSRKYRPERWIENPRLDKYLFGFGKGSRACAGINLAYAELTIALARLFRCYGSSEVKGVNDVGRLEVFETYYEDVECIGAMVLPRIKDGSKGVRMRVRSLN